jgi:hypothetical protein
MSGRVADTKRKKEVGKPTRAGVRAVNIVAGDVLVDKREAVSGPERTERPRHEFAVRHSS